MRGRLDAVTRRCIESATHRLPSVHRQEPHLDESFLIDRYGKHTGRIGDAPVPAVGSHDVLIEVHASSVNVLDSKISTGEFKLILPTSFH